MNAVINNKRRLHREHHLDHCEHVGDGSGKSHLRVSSLGAAAATTLLLEFNLLCLVGSKVVLQFALVFLTLALGAQVGEDGVEASTEGVLLLRLWGGHIDLKLV